MKVVSKHGVTHIEDTRTDIIRDPPEQVGFTQMLFLKMIPPIVLAKGVYRFKTHEAMNRQMEDAEFAARQQLRKNRGQRE